jgi:DNA-binding HxlR family transcriptional regulator
LQNATHQEDDMGKAAPAPRTCSIAGTLELVGERWTMLAMREVLLGVVTFDRIAHHTGAPRNILATRLGKLVEAGLLDRERYHDHPPRDRYVPTAAGRALEPVLQTLMAWGDEHLGRAEPPTVFEHSCGNALQPRVVCACCGEPAEPGSLRVTRLGGHPVDAG